MLRRILLTTILLASAADSSWATVAFVSSSTGNSGGSSVSSQATASLSITTGNFIAVIIGWYGTLTSVSTVTDTAGNTYYQCTGCYSQYNNYPAEDIWYAYNITGNASNVVTVTLNSASQYFIVTQAQYSGVATTSPFQAGSGGNGTGTTATTGSFNPTNVGLCIGSPYVASGPALTAGSGYTLRGGGAWEDNVSCPSGSQTTSVTWSGSNFWALGGASFSTALTLTSVTINKATINAATLN